MTRAAILLLGLLAGPASAHNAPSGWVYNAYCCQSSDCQPIPDHAVRITPEGYRIILEPGDHPMVTVRQEWTIPRVEGQQLRRSGDMLWHVCLYPTEADLRCVYQPPMGF